MSSETKTLISCDPNTDAHWLEGCAEQDGIIGSAHYEHGQWWITCIDTGAVWAVHDCSPGTIYFEQISLGDDE